MSEPDPTGDQHPAQKAAAKLPPWKKRLLITAAALMVLSLAAHAARLIWAEPEAGPTGDLSLARPFGAAEPGVDGTGDGTVPRDAQAGATSAGGTRFASY